MKNMLVFIVRNIFSIKNYEAFKLWSFGDHTQKQDIKKSFQVSSEVLFSCTDANIINLQMIGQTK